MALMIQYGFFILILISAIISSFVLNCFLHGSNYTRRVLFFCESYYFVLSLIKLRLEGANLTLFQSFWEANMNTYIHYGLPLCILAVVTPVVMYFIMKDVSDRFLNWHVSLFIATYSIVALSLGKITNAVFIAVFLVISIISLVVGCINKRDLVFCDNVRKKDIIKSYWPTVLFPAFLVLFYQPNELYLTNASEFYNSYYSFLIVLTLAMFVVALIIMFLLCLLPSSWVNKCINIIFGLSLCGYLQAMFFNGKMQSMIGVHQEWDGFKFIANIFVWLIMIIVLLVIGTRSNKLLVMEKWASLFMMSMLIVTIVTLFIQNCSNIGKTSGELTCEGDLTLGEKNVVVFVLDMYDIRYFEEIIDNNPDFAEPLKDFTLYDETIARHPYTAISIPYMLTGTQWREDESSQFQKYAYEGDTLLSRLYSADIDLGVYTSKIHFNESEYSKVRNYQDDISRESDAASIISVMAKASLYKMMPFVFKENYFYYTGDVEKMVKQGIVWSIDNDVPFYDRIRHNGITVDETLGNVFRFYHMRGEHWPFYLSEDVCIDETLTQANSMSQAKGCMNIVYAYIEELKAKGIYDNTTIIITADHGDIISYNSDNGKMSDYSMPILFVKKACEHNDVLHVNHAEVSHTELLATIMDEFNLDYSGIGVRLEDVPEGIIRERYFGYYTESEGVVSGMVVGDGRNVDNWVTN